MPKGTKGFQKGQVFTAEHRKKISIATSRYRLGKHHSKETKQKLSIKKIGSKNPMWKGGITPVNKKIRMSLEYKFWRAAVFERDNYRQ